MYSFCNYNYITLKGACQEEYCNYNNYYKRGSIIKVNTKIVDGFTKIDYNVPIKGGIYYGREKNGNELHYRDMG